MNFSIIAWLFNRCFSLNKYVFLQPIFEFKNFCIFSVNYFKKKLCVLKNIYVSRIKK